MVSKKNIYLFFTTAATIGLVIYLALLITKKTSAKNVYSITSISPEIKTTTLANTFSSKVVNLKINKTYKFYCIVYFNINRTISSQITLNPVTTDPLKITFDDSIIRTGGTVQPFYKNNPQLVLLQPSITTTDNPRYGFVLSNEIITVTSVNGFNINIYVPTSYIPTSAYLTPGEKFSLYFTFEETTPTTPNL